MSGRAGYEQGAEKSTKAKNAEEGEEMQLEKKCRMHKDSETPDAAALSTSVNNLDKSVLPHKTGNKQNGGREEGVEENKPANTQKNGGMSFLHLLLQLLRHLLLPCCCSSFCRLLPANS